MPVGDERQHYLAARGHFPAGGNSVAHLANSGTFILSEAALNSVCSRHDVCESVTVHFLGFGSQSRHGQNLAVLEDALLELAEQNAEA